MADYQDRLSALLRGELARSGMSQAELARQLGFQPQALSKWMNGKIEVLSVGAIASLADYLHKDRAALAHYLESGEWIETEPSELERLRARVEALEQQLRQRPPTPATTQETPASYITSRTPIKLLPLGMVIQDSLTEAGRDWRSPAVLHELHGLMIRPVDEGGLALLGDRLFPAGRLQRMIFGLIRPNPDEVPTLAQLLKTYTGDPKWTPEYIAGLLNGNGERYLASV